jgi:hypothetical protein
MPVAAELASPHHVYPRSALLLSEELPLRVDGLSLREGYYPRQPHDFIEPAPGHGAEVLRTLPERHFLLHAALAQPIRPQVLLVVQQHRESCSRHCDCVFGEFVYGDDGEFGIGDGGESEDDGVRGVVWMGEGVLSGRISEGGRRSSRKKVRSLTHLLESVGKKGVRVAVSVL